MIITRKMLEAVVATALSEIVPDFRPLMAALFLSHPVECQYLHQFINEQPEIVLLLETVRKFREDEVFFQNFVAGGFFSEQLEIMLETAKDDPVAARRLMPVFCRALNLVEELKIPEDLEEKIIKHIEAQRLRDGFAITVLAPGNIEVVPAPGVEIKTEEI